MKKTIKHVVLLLFVLVLSINAIDFAATAEVIDTTNLSKGIVTITYKAADTLKYKVLVTKDDKKISYPYIANGAAISFPLQLGNGTYKVGLLKNISGTKYAYVSQVTVELNLKDPNVVYLNSIQNINWNTDQEAIDFGKTLLKASTTTNKRVSVLYGYLVKNMDYDYDKISTLTSDYIPDVEKTYADLMGICYDYSALFASIERSHGIPTRLVKGYSKYVEGYHAWNEVLIDGKWVIIDNTVDSTWKGTTSSVTMIKNAKYYTKVNDY